MTKLLILFALMATLTFADDTVTTVRDNTMKNPDVNADGHTNGCPYIRLYTLRKQLTIDRSKPVEGQPKAIFYHNLDCLDIDLNPLRDTFTEFSYDDDLLEDGEQPHLVQLPEGCPPPIVERTPTICENGVKLGRKFVSDVTEVLTKQMAENPAKVMLPEDSEELDTEALTKVLGDLTSLEEDIARLVNAAHDDVEDANPTVEKFPNGVESKTYEFPNSTVTVVSRPGSSPMPQPGSDNTERNVTHQPPYTGLVPGPDGEEVTGNHENGFGPHQAVPGQTMVPVDKAEVPEGFYHSTVVTNVHSDDPSNTLVEVILLETMTTESPPRSVTKKWIKKPEESDEFVYQGEVERIPDVADHSSFVEFSTDPRGATTEVRVDSPLRFYRPQPSVPVDIPESFYTQVGNVSEEFAESLQDLVSDKAKCMLDQIFHQKEYQIELVCASTAAADNHNAILQNEIVKELFCNGDCDAFVLGVRDAMMDHINANGNPDDFKIESKKYLGDIVAGSAN